MNRLKDHIAGKVELTPTQVRSAEILLKKVLPDLAAIEHTGEVETSYIVRMPAQVATLQEWKEQNATEQTTDNAAQSTPTTH